MSPCNARLVKLAADHYSHLISQGKTVLEALNHAYLRYGVTMGAILREVQSRHSFPLPE